MSKRTFKPASKTARGRGDWQGMNWIRQEKRLAIYLRDGCACVWCGAAIEDEGTILTLDHVKPHTKGGTNDARNLVTACKRCNDTRQDRSAKAFAEAVATYVQLKGVSAEAILLGISAFVRRDLGPFLQAAKSMIAQRGSAAQALAERKA